MLRKILNMSSFLGLILGTVNANAALKVGDSAPNIKLKTHEDKPFDLTTRKGQWTVLYFYPKSETPGCTKQACAFRDSIQKIRDLKADVFGVSIDSVESQNKFHENHHLNFVILADPDGEATKAYGAKMPVVKMAKRWTFIIDPHLIIQHMDQNVDPVKDAANVAQTIMSLQSKK